MIASGEKHTRGSHRAYVAHPKLGTLIGIFLLEILEEELNIASRDPTKQSTVSGIFGPLDISPNFDRPQSSGP